MIYFVSIKSSFAGCVENINCMSKTVMGFDGQECERMSCDPECLPDEHLCDMGYNFEDGNLLSIEF